MTLFAPRAAQSSRKLLLLLLPTSLLILGPFFNSRAFGLNGSCPRIMITLSHIECHLGLGDRLFASCALPGLGDLLRPAVGFAALLLPLEIQGCLPSGFIADFRRRPLFRFRLALYGTTFGFVAGGRSECSAKRPLDPAGRLRMTPGFDIVAATTSGSSVSLATPLWKRLLPAPQANRAAFMEGAAIARSKKPSDV